MRAHGIGCVLVVVLWFGFSAFCLAGGPSRPEKKSDPPVQVIVDTSEAPEAAAWAEKARKLVIKWHPIIVDMLKTEGFVPFSEVKLVFKNDMKGPAATTGNTILISVSHIKQHPGDYGMVIHE